MTLYEQSPTLLNSTSANIAGTINFDTMYRTPLWLEEKDLDTVWEMLKDGFDDGSDDERFLEFSANALTSNKGLLWVDPDPRSAATQ